MNLEWDTEYLLGQTARGDQYALGLLLERFRKRLEHMVASRLDPLVAARLDPADVVQETLIEALRKLNGYLQSRPLPFYLWLRSIASERISKTHRDHLQVQARAVGREQKKAQGQSNGSGPAPDDRLVSRDSGPNEKVLRDELCREVHRALEGLRDADREVLVLCYLEGLTQAEVASGLGISVTAVKVRLFRAVRRFQTIAPRGVGPEGALPRAE